MPTGYTANIEKGISFQQFAMDCARAFGACVTLRDESGGGEVIPHEFTPSTYHLEKLESVRAEIASLKAMTDAECEAAANKSWDDAETQRTIWLNGKRQLRHLYESMLAKVEAWTPPTPEHVEMKEFMRSQIAESIRFDCSVSYYEEPVKRLSGKEWKDSRYELLTKNEQHHIERNQEEIERCKKRTEWVRALRESL